MTDRDAMKRALEALELLSKAQTETALDYADNAITALNERLAQPEQEPVAYTTGHCEKHKQKGGCQLHNLQCGWPDCDRKPITAPPQPEQDGKCKYCTDGCPACDARKLPPQRTWVGLTDEDFYGQSELQVMAMKYAEAKLKEKNHG